MLLAQPVKRDAIGRGLAGDLGQHLGQSLPRQRVDVSVCAEQEHSGRAELADEESQQEERCHIGRVQIV